MKKNLKKFFIVVLTVLMTVSAFQPLTVSAAGKDSEVTFTATTESGLKVTVTGNERAYPNKTVLEAVDVSESAVADYAKKAVKLDKVGVQAVELTYHKENNGKSVSISSANEATVTLDGVKEGAVAVLHIGSQVDLVEFIQIGDKVTFVDSGVGRYAVVYDKTPMEFKSASNAETPVAVVAEQGAFEEGTEMTVTDVDTDAVKETVEGDVVSAVDISFDLNGQEVQPAEGKTVTVTINMELDPERVYRLVHIDDNGVVTPVNAKFTADGVTFDAEGFSIYAVVDDGQGGANARLTVEFYNGETLIETMYVKNGDPDAEIDKIIFDPGTGEVDSENQELFQGWAIGVQNYTEETTKYTIQGVRDYIKNMAEWKEGDVLKIYAMVFVYFNITFFGPTVDGEKVSLGSQNLLIADRDATSGEYTIPYDYSPDKDTQKFEGWNVIEGNDKISGYTTGKLYQEKDTITISGNISLQAKVADGFFLIFDENRRGATYNSPRFYLEGEPTVYDAAISTQMKCVGYTFGGWYTDKDCTEGNEFEFGNPLTQNTTIYAKWTANTTADFVVLIWKQNVNGKDYDFAESITIEGTVGEAITAVTRTGTGNDAYAIVNGVNKRYTGFHLKEYDQNVIVKPEGSTILNVYYDRNVITLTFQIRGGATTPTVTTDTTGELYGTYDGSTYFPIFTNDNGQTWYTNAGSSYAETEELVAPLYGEVDGEYVLLSYDETIGWYYTDSSNYAANSLGDTVYGFVNNQYVELTVRDGKYYYLSDTEYEYTETTGTTGTQYALIDGNYVQIFYNNGNNAQNRYWYYNTYAPTTDNNWWNTTYYGLINGEYVALSYSFWDGYYTYNGQEYTGTRYAAEQTRLANNTTRYIRTPLEVEYTGTLYTHNIPYTGTYYKLEAAEYTGERYKYESGTGWKTIYQISGLYGSSLADNGYTWPSSYWWYENYDTGYGGSYSGSGTRTTFLDAFIIPSGASEETYYGFTGSGNSHVYWYKQNADGSWPALNSPTNEATSSGGTFYISDKYNGYKAYQYSTNGTSWTNLGDKNPTTGYYGSTSGSTIYVRFIPLQYNILYQDGVYKDGDGNDVEGYGSRGQLGVKEGVAYGSDLTSYNKGKTNYYEPEEFEGFVFDGWYVDDACTQPYTFTTMPEGITVYAKWRQVQYRVFMHSMATIKDPETGEVSWDDSLNWGSDSVSMSFRVEHGGTVSLPYGLRDEYTMIGWYYDAAYNNVYSGSTLLADSNTVAYDKTVDMTDPMDKHGEITDPENAYNSDANKERFWITRKLELYCKWSAVTPGAIGIKVEYDANGGSNAPVDNTYYKDNVEAVAQAASTAPAPTEEDPTERKFSHWIVQRWVEPTGEETEGHYVDTEVVVYPGDTFTVLKANSKQVVLLETQATSTHIDEHGNIILDEDGKPKYFPVFDDNGDPVMEIVAATYTVRLRAVYLDVEPETPTHITFYANGGEIALTTAPEGSVIGPKAEDAEAATTLTYPALKINEAVYALGPTDLKREGFRFVGWARTSEPSKTEGEGEEATTVYAFDPETGKTDETMYEETSGLTVWLKANLDDEGNYVLDAKGHYTFTEVGTENKNVTQVAADELAPYQALYAVWEKTFYVYHSLTKELEAITIDTDTFDLTSVVNKNALYGGYYEGIANFSSVIDTVANKAAADSATTHKTTITDTSVKEYDGSNLKANGTRFWNKSVAYRADGTKLEPVTGKVYYLKEVPNIYLSNNIKYIYNEKTDGKITDLYLLTTVDDSYYNEIGFKITVESSSNNKTTLVSKVTIQQRGLDGDASTIHVFTADSLIGRRGYIGYLRNTSLIVDNSTFTLEPYWVTPDGVQVYNSERSFTISGGCTVIE